MLDKYFMLGMGKDLNLSQNLGHTLASSTTPSPTNKTQRFELCCLGLFDFQVALDAIPNVPTLPRIDGSFSGVLLSRPGKVAALGVVPNAAWE